jgi:uncharacterized membrane-anchored protein YitT (DUF2179 family)
MGVKCKEGVMTTFLLPLQNTVSGVFISWKRLFVNLFLIAVGSCIFAVGVNSVLIPHKILSGGVIGVALIIHFYLPWLNTGLIYFILNVPLVLIGWRSISPRFMFYTSYGMAVFSLAAGFINFKAPPIDNPILAAILAGIICGIGSGVTLHSQGSTGGLDILGVFINKKLGLRVGSTLFMVNATVLLGGAVCFSLETALYSLIFVYTSGYVLDSVLTGFNQRKAIIIISDRSQAIADKILTKLHRGVTFLEGVGAYSGKEKQVILSVITLTETAKMKELVFDIDPSAFVVINDTLEVLGKRHGAMRAY